MSVCDLTDGRHLEAVGELTKVRWCKGESFGVRLSYDSDLSQIVGLFFSCNEKVESKLLRNWEVGNCELYFN